MKSELRSGTIFPLFRNTFRRNQQRNSSFLLPQAPFHRKRSQQDRDKTAFFAAENCWQNREKGAGWIFATFLAQKPNNVWQKVRQDLKSGQVVGGSKKRERSKREAQFCPRFFAAKIALFASRPHTASPREVFAEEMLER